MYIYITSTQKLLNLICFSSSLPLLPPYLSLSLPLSPSLPPSLLPSLCCHDQEEEEEGEGEGEGGADGGGGENARSEGEEEDGGGTEESYDGDEEDYDLSGEEEEEEDDDDEDGDSYGSFEDYDFLGEDLSVQLPYLLATEWNMDWSDDGLEGPWLQLDSPDPIPALPSHHSDSSWVTEEEEVIVGGSMEPSVSEEGQAHSDDNRGPIPVPHEASEEHRNPSPMLDIHVGISDSHTGPKLVGTVSLPEGDSSDGWETAGEEVVSAGVEGSEVVEEVD